MNNQGVVIPRLFIKTLHLTYLHQIYYIHFTHGRWLYIRKLSHIYLSFQFSEYLLLIRDCFKKDKKQINNTIKWKKPLSVVLLCAKILIDSFFI